MDPPVNENIAYEAVPSNEPVTPDSALIEPVELMLPLAKSERSFKSLYTPDVPFVISTALSPLAPALDNAVSIVYCALYPSDPHVNFPPLPNPIVYVPSVNILLLKRPSAPIENPPFPIFSAGSLNFALADGFIYKLPVSSILPVYLTLPLTSNVAVGALLFIPTTEPLL